MKKLASQVEIQALFRLLLNLRLSTMGSIVAYRKQNTASGTAPLATMLFEGGLPIFRKINPFSKEKNQNFLQQQFYLSNILVNLVVQRVFSEIGTWHSAQ